MAFWSKKTQPAENANLRALEAQLRASNPTEYDLGAQVNRKARELQRVAAKESSEPDHSFAVTALHIALGNEIAALVARRNPNLSPDQKRQMINQVLDTVCPAGVREAAYSAANLPMPVEEDILINRIVHEATKNDTPVQEAVSATAEALGRMIAILSERPGYSSEELIKYGQNAVAHFARETLAFRQTRKD
jgi:hypothetical protein